MLRAWLASILGAGVISTLHFSSTDAFAQATAPKPASPPADPASSQFTAESGLLLVTIKAAAVADYGIAVVVPDFVLPTSQARSVLPESYSKADTIFNVQRSALLIAALATGTTSAFPTALEDRLHQPYRVALIPGLEEILRLRAPGLLGCALSGAGPSILVFYERGFEGVCDLVRQIFARHGLTGSFWSLA